MSHRVLSVRTMIVTASVLVLTVLSSSGALDNYAKDRVKGTTEESIKIFALSKSINAGISVLQSSQVKIPFFASIQVGEALDPINDAVERLSSAMVWATGALFLQQIILEVASSSVFKWGVFVIGLVAISALLLAARERFRNRFCEVFKVSEATLVHYRDSLVRIFIVTSIFRFIVPAFVIISFLLSQMFLLDTEIDKLQKNLSKDKKNLPLITEQVSRNANIDSVDTQQLEEERPRLESSLAKLKKSLSSYQQEAEKLDKRIDQLNEKVGWGQWVLERVPGFLGGAPPEKELVSAKEKREKIDQKMEGIQERIHAINEELECINKRLAGKSCDSLLSKFSSIPSAIIPDAIKTFFTGFTEFPEKANEMVKNITKLLAAIVIKNILLPLVFLLIAIKGSFPFARWAMRLVSGSRRELQELQG